MKQGVPEGRSSEGYAFKQVKPWPWHVEVIPGVSVVGHVTNKVLCRVLWGIIVKNFMYKYSFIVRERERETNRQRQTERGRDREDESRGTGREFLSRKTKGHATFLKNKKFNCRK